MTVIKNIVLACVLSCSFLYAESNNDKATINSENSVKEKPIELTSQKGMKFWFLRDKSSKLVHVKIAFLNCGTAYLQKSKCGTAALYSEAVFCGAGRYSKQDFEKQCHDNSILISCYSNLDNLQFSLTTSEIVLQDAANLLNLLLVSPKFDEKEVLKVQNSTNFGEAITRRFLPAKVFESHAYSRGEIGEPEDYMKLTIKDLNEYRRRFLVKKNAKVFVCGALTEQQAKALVDKVFSDLPDGTQAKDTLKDVEPRLLSKVDKYYQDGPQSKILFALKGEKFLSKRRMTAIVLFGLLGNGTFMRSKIFTKLRTEQGLIYVGYVYPVDLNHANVIFGTLITDNKKTETAMFSLKSIIKELKEKGITQEELDLVKSNILGTILVGLRTSAALSQFYFQNLLKGRGANVIDEITERMRQVQVSDVNSLAREILNDDAMSFVVIGGNA